MDTVQKYLIGILAVFAVAIVGAYYYPTYSAPFTAGSSTVGSTFTQAKFYGVVMQPATGATTSSITNTDASDRFIVSYQYGCTGVGSSQTPLTGAGLVSNGWSIGIATTATSGANPNSNVNQVNMLVATSTSSWSYSSLGDNGTTTATGIPQTARVWAAGGILTFAFNATNTATCTVGAFTLPS